MKSQERSRAAAGTRKPTVQFIWKNTHRRTMKLKNYGKHWKWKTWGVISPIRHWNTLHSLRVWTCATGEWRDRPMEQKGVKRIGKGAKIWVHILNGLDFWKHSNVPHIQKIELNFRLQRKTWCIKKLLRQLKRLEYGL